MQNVATGMCFGAESRNLSSAWTKVTVTIILLMSAKLCSIRSAPVMRDEEILHDYAWKGPANTC